MPDEKRVNVVARGGGVRSVTPEEAEKLEREGFAVREGDEARFARHLEHKRKVRHTNTEDKIQTFGEGILSSMSLGVTDHFLDDDAGKRAEYNRGFRVVGELLGLGAGIAGGSGKNILSFTPAGALFKTSRKAGERVAGSLGARGAVEGLIEGGGFGIAQTISNAGLHDDPITAEKLASNLSFGALTGGGIGGLFGSGAQFFRKEAAEAAENVNFLYNPAGEVARTFDNAIDVHLASLQDDFFDAVGAARKGPPAPKFVDPDDLIPSPLTDVDARIGNIVAQRGDELQGLVQSSGETAATGAAKQGAKGFQAAEDIAELPTGIEGPRLAVHPNRLVRGVGQPIPPKLPPLSKAPGGSKAQEAIEALREVGQLRKGSKPPQGVSKRQLQRELAERKALLKAQEPLDELAFAKTQEFTPNLAPVSGEIGEKVAARRIQVPGDFESLRPLVDDFSSARNKLHKAFGGKGRKYNSSALARKSPEEALIVAKALDDYGQAIKRADEALGTNLHSRYQGLFRQLSPLIPDNANVVLQRISQMDAADLAVATGLRPEAIQALGKEAQEFLGLYAMSRAGIEGQAKAVTKRFTKWVKEAEKNAGKFKNPVLRGSVGLSIAAPFIYSPVFMAYRLAQTAGGVGVRISKAVSRFLTTGTKGKALKKLSPALSSKVITNSLTGNMFEIPGPKADKPIKERMREVAHAVSHPKVTAEAVDALLMPLKAQNIGLGFRVADNLVKRLEYLMNKMPKPPTASPLNQSRWEPSATQMSKWARYLESTEDPIGRLEKELAQEVISVEMVETLKTVYPNIYEEVRKEVFDQVMAGNLILPYQKRMALSTLFEITLDPAASTQFGRTMQGTHARAEQGPQPQGMPTSPTALRENVLNTQTKGQKLTER